jgi:hypothetical protein
LNELWQSSRNSASQQLAVEAMVRNYVRCEFFDREGKFRGQELHYMHWVDGKKEVFIVAIPLRKSLGRVKMSY